MNLRSLVVTLALALLAAFALLNWTAFTAPTTLSLAFTEVQAPLGLIMLVVTGFVSGLFLVYIAFQQAGVILEARRYAKELKAHRELADKAEASRFTELRVFIEGELRRIEAQGAAGTAEVRARIEQLQQQFQEKLAESTLTLSAYVGEVDDKLDRMSGPADTPRT
ncbi:MAG: LapA family protein [Burkholderiaceae bacterium]|nr:LapA family protein [Burkholderiaceae bacterium]